MFTLRPYQRQAVDKLLWSRDLAGADLGILPTGSGKSIVIAELANEINKNILIIQPTKEILEQNVSKLSAYVSAEEIGIYSASAGRKDINKFTFATIQSIYQKAEEFKDFGYVIIDECHLVNAKRDGSMFMTFLEGIGKPKVVGFTATPYRLDISYTNLGDGNFLAHTAVKLINRTKGNFWKRVMFNINIGDLIEQGQLTALKYIDKTILDHERIPTNISQSDFNLERYVKELTPKQDKIVEAVFFAEALCKHVLVFCATVEQAEVLHQIVEGSGIVTAKTKKKDRERLILDFREGRIKTVFNVGVLTTGFDFPELDGIVLLRPTRSIGLYYQMLGRGVRNAPGKKSCKVIDLTGTVKQLGRVETIRFEKVDGKWELLSEKGSWHNTPLYSFIVSR